MPNSRTRSTMSASICLALAGCGQTNGAGEDNGSGAVVACVEATKDTMRVPSSYKTLWTDYTERQPFDAEERRKIFLSRICKPDGTAECPTDADRFMSAAALNSMGLDRLRVKIKKNQHLSNDERITAEAAGLIETPPSEDPADKTGFVLLEYESENSFGARLREFGICRLGRIGEDRTFEKSDVVRVGPIPLEEGIRAKDQYTKLNGQSQ